MTEVDLQPETSAVLQEEETYTPVVDVSVCEIKAPVRTQELPRKAGSTRTLTLGTDVLQVLRADHFRANATLMSIDQNIYIAFSAAASQATSSMTLWPKLVPFTVTATVDVYVVAATSTTSLSVTTERWATGD